MVKMVQPQSQVPSKIITSYSTYVSSSKPKPTRLLTPFHYHTQSSRTLSLDPITSLPTGTLNSVSSTHNDFRTGKTIGDGYPQGGYDDYWVFDKESRSQDFVFEDDGKDRVGEVLKAT